MTIKDFKDNLSEIEYLRFDYHEFETVKSTLQDALDYISDDAEFTSDFERIDGKYVQDLIMEHCDSATPVYNSDRADWFAKNWSAADDYIEEFGEVKSIMDAIGGAYYMTLERDCMELFELCKS